MPATTSLFIDKYHPRTDGKCNVSVRVTFERKKKYYPTGMILSVSDFEKTQGEKPRNEFKQLALKLQSKEKKAADIIDKLPAFTFKAFEKQYNTNKGTRDYVSKAFADYAAALTREGRIGTSKSHQCAQISLTKFAPDAKFIDITPEFLRKYEKWMLAYQENSITTVGIYLRALRTIFNNAITDGLLSKDYYPFGKKKYEIPTGNNIKKARDLKDIAAIYHYKPDPGSLADMAKDYWIFMYLCNGMNVKDLCLLKYDNIKGDVLEFERAKTARTKRKVEPIRIALTDETKAIIKKWGNKRKIGNTFILNSYIFPVLEKGVTPEREYQLIQQTIRFINDQMKIIAGTLGIESSMTTYVARHSFATVMQRSGASTEFISEALGHSNVKTTQNYLAGFEDETKCGKNINNNTDNYVRKGFTFTSIYGKN